MSFHVGQKVVCIDNPNGILQKNAIYTIDAMRAFPDGLGLHFIEHPISGNFFFSEYFRLLIKRKTDIGFAHEILRKVTRKNRVRA